MTRSLTCGRTSRAVLKIACLFLLGAGTVLADTLWTRRYSGPAGGDDAVRVVLTDVSRNVIVVGSTIGWGGYGKDFVVLKYSPRGDTLWTRQITGSDTSDDVAQAAAIDPSSAVCITGQTGSYPDYDILTVKLNPDGSESWRAVYQGTAHADDGGTAIAVDNAGNVFVTGYASNATNKDYVTIKYNLSNGSQAWTAVYNGGGDDVPTAIALGPDGGVYVTGYSRRGGSDDYATVKYSAAGTEEWTAFYNGPASAPDQPVALAVDPSGSAYVTGRSATGTGPSATNRYATAKYDSAGAEQWVARYEHDGSTPAALALGASALYVTGQSAAVLGDADWATIAYDPGTGDTLWVRLDSGPGGSGDVAVDVVVGPDSGVWVTGSSNYDFTTVLYTPDGVRHWVETYSSPGDDQPAALAVDAENKVIVTGVTWAGAGYDIVTVKFDTLGLAVAEPGREPVSDFRLSIAPNPSASGLATLRFGPAEAGAAVITVFGVAGRVVPTHSIEAGTADATCLLDLRKLGAGVYIVRLECGGRSATQKLVVGE